MTSLPIDRTATEVFEEAYTSFCDTLSEDEWRILNFYPMAENMLESVRQIAEGHPAHQSCLTKVCRRIDNFASRLESFFEIIDIFVHTNPQYSGLVWGAIRLVFLKGTNYATFLEKLSAMIEKMTVSLPAYEEYIRTLRSRAPQAYKDGKNHRISNHLLKALAYVFADVLQFCQEACGLFSKHGKGVRKKVSFINALIWNPFDKRFNDLILRFENHKKLFELEMNMASTAEALRFYAVYEEKMRIGENHKQEQNSSEQQQEQQDIAIRVLHLKEWIRPPLWQESLDRAKAQRSPSTGLWVFQEPVFKLWLSNATTPETSISQNIMHVEAKPGYGKTTLCGLVIEHLLCSRTRSGLHTTTDDHTVSNVAFYFFEEQRKRHNLAGDALRAILAQLIHIHRNNMAVIDAASVIWAKDEIGQASATINEVSSILQLLLRQTISTTLVFDGIDECSDTELFFKYINEITKDAHHVSLLFFSRPIVKLSRYFSNDYYSIELRESQNLLDMTRFLSPKIWELLDTGALVNVVALTAEDIALKIAIWANGIFLWTSLFIEYLQSPAMTVRERWDALENLNRLEGLDALCGTILASLKNRYHGNIWTNIKRTFQWVAHAFRPLCVVELNTALNAPLDRAVTSEDVIPNFKDSLELMSGALLEISADNTVRFIHLSIAEFFTGTGSEQLDNFDVHGSDFQTTNSHRYMAASCLSYFCYTVPAEPLGGSASITPDVAHQKSKFPLLDYGSQFWSRHMITCLADNSPGDSNKDDNCSWDQLSTLMSTFLYNKSMVAVWIEASWLFGKPPELNVSGLQPEITEFLHSVPSQQAPELTRLLADMKRLSSDLQTLNSSWCHVLRHEPNEIWQPSISEFHQSNFWTQVAGSNLLPIGQSTTESKVLCSRASTDGLRIGIVRVDGVSLFRYEIWTVDSNTISSAFDLDSVEWNSAMSITISHDLRKICLGDCLLKFDTAHYFQHGQGPAIFSRSRFSSQLIRASCVDPSESFKRHVLTHFPQNMRKEVEDGGFSHNIHVQLSPEGEYILAVLESSRLVDRDPSTSARLWVMEVFRDTDHQIWNKISLESQNLTHYFPPSGTKIRFLDREAAFHPFLPQLALSRFDDTCLWDFNGSIGITPVVIHKFPLARISFTADGSYLCGIKPCSIRYPESQGSGEYRSRDVLVRLSQPSPLLIDQFAPSISAVTRTNQSPHQQLATRHSETSIPLRSTPAIQSFDNVGLGRDHDGVAYMSMLRNMDSQGARVRHTLREDGMTVSETLTRLPEGIIPNSNATILASTTTQSTEMVRIGSNRAYNDSPSSYDTNASDTYPLPAMLERTGSIIPAFIRHDPMSLGDVLEPPRYHQTSSRRHFTISHSRPRKKTRHTPGSYH